MWQLRQLIEMLKYLGFIAVSAGIPFIFHLITGFCCACYIYVYQFAMFWFVFVRCLQTKDFVAASVEYSLGMCSFPGFAHFVYMKIYATRTMYIVEKYLKCDSLVIKGTRYFMNLQKFLRIIKKRALTVWIMLIVNGLIYLIYPIVMPGRDSPQDHYVIYGLEPITESPNYEIGTVLKTAGVIFTVYVIANVIALYLVLYGYIEAHLLAMSKELKYLWDDSNKFFFRKENRNKNIFKKKERIVNEYIAKQLKDIIQLHIENINLVKILEDGIRGTRVLGLLSMTVAIISELLGGLENTFIQIPYTFVVLFMDCLAGQKIIDANDIFANALYMSKWENFNVSNRKLVLRILINAQKVLTISAGGFMNLNFASFTNVIRFTYSTYTTLKSTMK